MIIICILYPYFLSIYMETDRRTARDGNYLGEKLPSLHASSSRPHAELEILMFFSDKHQPYSTILTSQPPLHHITSTCFPWSWSCKCIVYFRQWRWTNQLFHTDVFSHFRNHHICPLWKTTMKNAIGIYVVLFFFYKRTLTPWPPWPHFTEVEPRQELPAWAQPPDRPPPHATPNGRQVPLVRVGMRHQQGMCIIDHIDF